MAPASKSFPTLAVVGTWSGRLLVTGGFSDIHEVMDHLYPGIMTPGLAAMAKHAAVELLRQHPELSELTPITPENYAEVAREAEKRFGPTLTVNGPIEVDQAIVKAAFDELGKGGGLMLACFMRPGKAVKLVEGPVPFWPDESFSGGSVGDLEEGAELVLANPSPAFLKTPGWWIARSASGGVTLVKPEIVEAA